MPRGAINLMGRGRDAEAWIGEKAAGSYLRQHDDTAPSRYAARDDDCVIDDCFVASRELSAHRCR